MLMWIKIIFFIIGNAPALIRLIRELRGLMKELPAYEKEALIRASKDDIEIYKIDGDLEKLLSKVAARKEARKEARQNRRG